MEKQIAYDSISYKLSVNIYSLNKDNNYIDIYGLDLKKKSHKWFFNIAMTCSHLFGKNIRVDMPFFNRLWIYLHHRKELHWIKRAPERKLQISVDEMLNYMLPSSIETTGDSEFNYDKIYDFYVEE